MERRALASGLRHGGRLQRRLAPADARAPRRTRRSPASTACSTPTAGSGAIPRSAADLPLDPRQRAGPAPELRLPDPGDLPRRRRLPAQRGPDPRPGRSSGPQIAALKALGYTNREIGWHYVKWAWSSPPSGPGIGIVGGRLAGLGHDRALQRVLPLPDPATTASSGDVAVAAAAASRLAAGALGALLRGAPGGAAAAGRGHAPGAAGALPHELRRAPRPPAPAHPRHAHGPAQPRAPAPGAPPPRSSASPSRRPSCVFGFFFLDAMDAADGPPVRPGPAPGRHGHASSSRPPPGRSTRSSALPGVIDVEPFRSVPVRLRSGHRSRNLAVTGMPARPDLSRDRRRSRAASPTCRPTGSC